MKIDHKESFRNCMTVVLFAVCFYFLWDIYHIPKEKRSDDASDVKMLCITTIGILVGYIWGSSTGSRRNAEVLRNLVNPSDGTTVIKTESPKPKPETREDKQKRLDALLLIQNPSTEQLAEIKLLEDEIKLIT